MDWHPGHYISVTSGDSAPISLIASEPNVVGVKRRIFWKMIERTEGDYTLTSIQNLLNDAQVAGKKVFVEFTWNIEYYLWDDVDYPDDDIPDWVHDRGWTVDWSEGYTIFERVKVWEDDARAGYLAHIRAVADAFSDHPALAGVILGEETALDAMPFKPSAEVWTTTVKDILTAVRAMFPTKVVMLKGSTIGGSQVAWDEVAEHGALIGAGGMGTDFIPVPLGQTIQAESAIQNDGAQVAADAGANGGSYVDFPTTGGSVQLTVNTTGAGEFVLDMRYANGDSATHTLSYSVNGGAPVSANFPPTGGWSNWKRTTFGSPAVALNAGANTIRFDGPGSPGGPHLDEIDVRGQPKEQSQRSLAAMSGIIPIFSDDTDWPYSNGGPNPEAGYQHATRNLKCNIIFWHRADLYSAGPVEYLFNNVLATINAHPEFNDQPVPASLAVPPAITTQPGSQAVITGADATFSVAIPDAGSFSFQWFKDGVALSGASGPKLTIRGVQAVHSGIYTVVVSNLIGSVTSQGAVLSVADASPPPAEPRLINLSTRAFAGSGDATLIVGFYIGGTGSKTLVIRGVGPKLGDMDVPVVVADPSLTLYAGDTPLFSNDNWDPALAADFASVGAFQLDPGSKDAAMKVTLEAGSYTVHLVNPGPIAEALVEIYDLSRDPGSRLVNLSSRLNLNAGGTVIVGTHLLGGAQSILVRSSGPALAATFPEFFTPESVLADPRLTVYSGQTAIDSNEDWNAEIAPRFASAGAFGFPAGSKDAAIHRAFAEGAYTVHASGTGEGGVTLIELYESP